MALNALRRTEFFVRAAIPAVLAFVVACILYGPATGGPFVFDDIGLPFYQTTFRNESLAAWLSGVRPLLMLSYWANFQISARDPWSYHAANILLHACNSYLVFVLFSRILSLQRPEIRWSRFLAAAGAAVFLVHPLQTESVAYIAGRSELLCGLFTLAALTVFLGYPATEAISRKRAAAVIVLYACAVLSKEQAAVLPVLFLLFDRYLRRESFADTLRKGLPLYAPMAIAGSMALLGVAVVLSGSRTAGFNVPGLHWYEYLFTQFRVWMMYLWLAVFPLGQNADYDLAVSRTLWDNGAAIAAIALGGVAFYAVRARRRLPLLFCGFVLFAALLAPTSSVIPLQDLAAERRMYLPIAGLILAGLQLLTRMRLTPSKVAAIGMVLLCYSGLTYARAGVWASDIALWTDVTRAAPLKVRGHTQLTYAYMRVGRCRDAIRSSLRAPALVREDPLFMATIGQAYACERRWPEAADSLERAVLLEPSAGRMLALAAVYRESNRPEDADATEQQAFKFPPKSSYDVAMLRAFNFRARSETRQSASENYLR